LQTSTYQHALANKKENTNKMFTLEQSGRLDLTTPLTSCCNCGAIASSLKPVELIDTPLKRTRFFFFIGSELTITETFPYCKRCQSSASRLRQGWFSKILCAALFCAVLMLILVLAAPFLGLPLIVMDNLFTLTAAFSLLATYFYFRHREADAGDRSYYQPVSLADVEHDALSGNIGAVTLRLTNLRYAHALAQANAAMMQAGVLKIVSVGDGQLDEPVQVAGTPATAEGQASSGETWVVLLIVLGIIPWAIFWVSTISPAMGLTKMPWVLHFLAILGAPVLLWSACWQLFFKKS
jgi:hypothetical protein